MIKKKGLDSLNPFGRTVVTLEKNIQVSFSVIQVKVLNALKHINFSVFVISLITKFQQIVFCHTKKEHEGDDKSSTFVDQKTYVDIVNQQDKKLCH